MKTLIRKHISSWSQRSFLAATFMGVVFLVVSLTVVYYANYYTTIRASNVVTDILLDNLPVWNVGIVYSEGAAIFLFFLLAVVVHEPKRIPFLLKSIALFIVVRSIFMVMTHLAPPLHPAYLDTDSFFYKLSSGDDLFFSAHTGMPFLLALTFWHDKKLRFLFLLCTIVGATAVIFGHLHYTIDVFSAFFITYGIFRISVNIFHKDYQLSLQSRTQ